MQLYYAARSPPCRAVLLFLQALSLEPDLIALDLIKGEQLTPEYLKLNPQHTVPLIVDDGFILSESRAILGYLADKYASGTTYYPNDPMARGIVNQRLNFDIGTLYARLHETYMEPMHKGKTSVDNESKMSLMEALDVLEVFLGNATYMAGDKITIADYSIVVSISTLNAIGVDLSAYSGITTWYNRCKGEMKKYEEIDLAGAQELANRIKTQLRIN